MARPGPLYSTKAITRAQLPSSPLIFKVNLPAAGTCGSSVEPIGGEHRPKEEPVPSYGSADRPMSALGPGPERPLQGGGASRATKRFFVIAITSRAQRPRA